LPDILVSNIATEFALEESHFVWVNNGKLNRMKDGIAPFADESETLGLSRSGWGWDIRIGDFNNDLVPEVVQATGFLRGDVNRWPELHELAMGNDELLRNPGNWPRFHPGDDLNGEGHTTFFVRDASGRYYDLAADVGLNDIRVTRGVATADVDGDGRLDLAVASQWDSSWFFRNESKNAGAFLGLRLLLPVERESSDRPAFSVGRSAINGFGRPAIGASATVFLPDGQKLISQVDGGNGHSGKRSQDLHFGLGSVSGDTPVRVELRWRGLDGQVSLKTIYLTPGWHTVLLGE
jgi:enediyne biosynthesis protein E4